MGSATASPETSPTRADKARTPGSEINTPKTKHSSTGEEQSLVGEHAENANNEKLENQDTVIRKGRGNFRGPGSENQPDQQQQATRSPRGRDFDATSLRQYPPKSGGDKTPNKGHNRKKSKSDSRQNSNGVQGSESGGSSSDNNVSDDVTKIATSLENITIGQQNVEEWEKHADGEVKIKSPVSPVSSVASPADGNPTPFDWSSNRQKEGQKNDNSSKNENRGGFKKGHKKSKSSKIEFNFDPDAFEGSTRILDIFDFPASFKTHHLHEIFQEYENMRGGYRIKWMDDTRALIIFEHPATARKAYLDNVTNQTAQIKPYDGPTDFLQKNPNNAQPRARPATTDMVAKRLVHGALGVRVARSPEQRQAENQMLRNARDQREQKRNEYTRRSQDLDAAFNE
ncbi:coiled-coil domain-containing protein R3HCC1L [Rhizophagus clarus]|uniref:Coiled-coil domain-containing protein R3HCC1L n=1 Tax=Rhizophagus clarus TaxID=94130 RepID=A0A8H3LR30_9GLOM|nr:coiled-coil domain-containing protein R3HCC1L [Rhizophagus clarus]